MPELTSQVHPSLDGNAVSEIEVLRYEVDRSRVALLLLKDKLGPEGLKKLLKEETDASARQFTEWSNQSDGKYLPSTAEVNVDAGSAEGFVKWFGGVVAAKDEDSLNGGNPEHFIVLPTPTGQEVMETLGAWGLPMHFFIELDGGPSVLPDRSLLDPAYPVKLIGVGHLGGGATMGAVLHQFANTENGFKAKLCIYYPAAAAPALIEGHRHHLVCEFVNWINMYLVSASLR